MTEENLKVIFGNSITVEDVQNSLQNNVQNKKIDFLKWAFTLTNNEISAVQMLVIRENINNTGDNRLQSATFVLSEMLNLSDVSAKTNVQNEVVGEYIKSYKNAEGNYTVIDFTNFANNLEATKDGTSRNETFTRTPADEDGKEIFKSLMSYVVNEETHYIHVSVNYRSSTHGEFGSCFEVTISLLNEFTNFYENWIITLDDNGEKEQTDYQKMQDAIGRREIKCSLTSEKEMLSGDIIFNVGNGNENVIEISPYSQQSAIEKQ